MDNGNYSIIPNIQVPTGETILPEVWKMKRKREIKMRDIKKWKVRLNIDGFRMKNGIHYEQTYAPVVSWKSIRLLLKLSSVHKWKPVHLDYIIVLPHAPVEKELYMKIPKGFESYTKGDTTEHVLKLHKNVYGQNQVDRVWYQYLEKNLMKNLGFKHSTVEECVFFRGRTIYTLYTDYSILAVTYQEEIYQIVEDLKRSKLILTVGGDLKDFLGVNI